jgi:hypothetical protein
MHFLNAYTTHLSGLYAMKTILLVTISLFIGSINIHSQSKLDSIFPVRGFCISAPLPERLDEFVKFINTELAPRKVNTLILRIDYAYMFESHPELRDPVALSKQDVKKLVNACRNNHIRLIPQINLLGHQSWAEKVNNLLIKYPEFDETPYVKMPEKYQWPNSDGLYCKSYCPLHPGVHKVVFDLIDEICEAFESDGFHAGMDEVFYLGQDSCIRCVGHDKAELFAGEVRTIHDHLLLRNRSLWIWGDRLIDGRTTGIGMWEASFNTTYRAIDLIPKDVMICDWHYERAEQTPVYFAMKGLNVVTCPWRVPSLAVIQADDMVKFRKQSSFPMKEHFQGMLQTIWTDTGSFLDEFYGRKTFTRSETEGSQAACFKALFDAIQKYQ